MKMDMVAVIVKEDPEVAVPTPIGGLVVVVGKWQQYTEAICRDDGLVQVFKPECLEILGAL